MSTKHFCHYLKARNAGRNRNSGVLEVRIETRLSKTDGLFEVASPEEQWGNRYTALYVGDKKIVLNKTENIRLFSVDRINHYNNTKLFRSFVTKYNIPLDCVGPGSSFKIPAAELNAVIKKCHLGKDVAGIVKSARLAQIERGRRAIEIPLQNGRYILDEQQRGMIAKILKNGEDQLTNYSNYARSGIIDAKIMDRKIGVVLRQVSEWGSGGGIGLRLWAEAQYRGSVYQTETIAYRDRYVQARDKMESYANKIDAAYPDAERGLSILVGGRWHRAKKIEHIVPEKRATRYGL